MMLLLRNSDGRKDGAWTLAVVFSIALAVTMLVGGSEWSEAGGLVVRIPPPDGTSIAAQVAAVGAYVWRRRDKAREA